MRKKKDHKVNEGHSGLKSSKVNCGLGCLCFIPAGDHCVLFLGRDSTIAMHHTSQVYN